MGLNEEEEKSPMKMVVKTEKKRQKLFLFVCFLIFQMDNHNFNVGIHMYVLYTRHC